MSGRAIRQSIDALLAFAVGQGIAATATTSLPPLHGELGASACALAVCCAGEVPQAV